jgi:TatA/E family protein of Tat protein translocase
VWRVFGSLGGPEIIFIFVLALLLFGPRKLPEIGRTVGRALSEFRRATQEFRGSLERDIALEEMKDVRRELGTAAREAGGALVDAGREAIEPPSPTANEGTAEDR